MQRREALQSISAACTIGIAGVSGCLGDPGGDADGGDGGDARPSPWSHEVAGRVDARAADRVFGRENFADDAGDGGVFALDADAGDHEWTHGETGGYSMYTELAVDDAVYVGFGDDAIGSGSGETIAVEFDGEVRWTRDTGSVYSCPVLDDDAVYVAGDDRVVYAFDRERGDVRWRATDVIHDEHPEAPHVTAVDDAVYLGTGRLLALDPANGDPLWRVGESDDRIRRPVVVDDVAYVRLGDDVVAVADGEELWRITADGGVYDVVDGRVLLLGPDRLDVRDPTTGDRLWAADEVSHPLGTAGGVDVVYATADERELVALDADEGDRQWSLTVDDGGEISGVHVATDVDSLFGDDAVPGDDAASPAGEGEPHGVLVRDGSSRLSVLTAGGETAWTGSADGSVRNVLVDDGVFVGTDEGIQRLVPS